MTTLRHLDNVRLACLHTAIAVLLAGLLLPQGTAAQEPPPSIGRWAGITLISMDCDTGVVSVTVDVEELVGPLRMSWYALDGSNTQVQAGSAIVEETWPYTGSLPFQFTMPDLSQVHSLFITADILEMWAFISVGVAVPCGATPPVDVTLTWPGDNVTVAPLDGVTVTFDKVLYDGGNTTVTPTTAAPALPNGYVQVGGVFYEVETTAAFTGLAKICFTYDPSAEGAASFRLMHYENDAWVDVTSFNDGSGTICGLVSSFSPFALVIPPSVPVVREDCLNGGWQAYGYANQGLCLRDVLKPND